MKKVPSTCASPLAQVWDLESFACLRTLDHDGRPVQLIEIAGTRLHSVSDRTVPTQPSPGLEILEALQQCRAWPQGVHVIGTQQMAHAVESRPSRK